LIGNSVSFKKICSIRLTCALLSIPRSFSSSSGVRELNLIDKEFALPSIVAGIASVPLI